LRKRHQRGPEDFEAFPKADRATMAKLADAARIPKE
jgi:hypothetical protein